MNQFLKKTAVLLLFVLISCTLTAQKYITHAVKSGETLESIAKQYRVTPYNILKFNKEIKLGQELRPNTILVISPGDTEENRAIPLVEVAPEEQEDPIGFASHRVRKKETLYGIAKRYNITENDIKKYNPELYSSQLKKKMRLRIPKYRRLRSEENTINEADFETYTVASQETRWSIAHKYGITIDSMLVLNPNLSKINDYLRQGQELRMPKIAGSSVEEQVTQLYVSYTVPAKMTLYSLGKEYDIKPEDIVRLNPEIIENNGLKEGMVIRLPEKKIDLGAVNTDNFIFYEVKPKQTFFSLTRKLGISYTDLLALNPDLKLGLKTGMVLKLPKDQTGDFEVKNALILDKINLLDSINTDNRPKIMFLLPFKLNKLNLNNKSEVKKAIKSRESLKYSLGLYSGALIALDFMAKLGVSVDVKTFDNQFDPAKTKEILFRENLMEYSAIVGPLDVNSLKEVAVQASKYQIPVIAPISVAVDMRLNNVFFSRTSNVVLRKKMIDYVEGQRTNQNIIIIADARHVAVRDSILKKFPGAKVAVVKEEEKNIGVNIERLKLLLSKTMENWIFVETDDFKLVSSVTSILNSFQNVLLDPLLDTERISVRMLTTDKNDAFDNDVISSSHLSNLNFTYPSVYREVSNDTFVKQYRKRFGDTPDRYAVRGFDLTYDLLLKLAYKKNLVEVSKIIGETEYTGNKFSYEKKDAASGYFNQASYIMAYEDMRIKEVKDQLQSQR
ncbi:MAG: LysM peptidoglycan-binding domain-containing protein [Flavobacteriaceae bacterium]